MSTFPKRENDIVGLCEAMIAGYTEFPDDFPSGAPAGLQTMLNSYKASRDSQGELESKAEAATATKNTDLEVLITTMKNSLKQAEVDVFADPQKLSEIGWGPKAQPVPLTPPSAPSNIRSIAEGQAMLWLEWDKSPTATGGAVWNYIVERRQEPLSGGGFSEWTFAGTSYDCTVNLTEQPTNVRLEYRVRASNTAGQSAPSNAISVVLP